MTELVSLVLCEGQNPPGVREASTADRRLDACAARADRRGALADWIRGMIRAARDAGLTDDAILAEFVAGAERFRAEYAGEVPSKPIPTESPAPMDCADQLSCVLSALATCPPEPKWYEGAAREAVEIAEGILKEGAAA